MSNQKIENLFESYFELESDVFFSHDEIGAINRYKDARKIMNQIEKLLGCQYKRFIVSRVELSDPMWTCTEDDDVFPVKISLEDLRKTIDVIDNVTTSRWVNPILLVVPVEIYRWLDKEYDEEIYLDLAIYGVAAPCSGYSGNYYEWVQLNKKKYLPKVLKAAKSS